MATWRLVIEAAALASIRAASPDSPPPMIADHATAQIRWYKFVPRSDAGSPLDRFEIIGTAHTTKRYCNVDLALRDVAGVPLPRDFAGANRVDGCFAGK